MRHWKRFCARLRNLLHAGRAEEEMAREVAAHLALIEDDFQRRGLTPEAARLAARRAWGGVEQTKELHRDERSFAFIEPLRQDVRHALRSLSKSRGFTTVALLSLAFGIGVNTAIFTLVNGILLKKLALPDADRIVQISAHMDEFDTAAFNFPVFRELRRQTSVFQDVIGVQPNSSFLTVDNADPRRINLELVTGSYFSFFGARPVIGRLLDEEDDRVEGAHAVCVISYQAWQSYFGGDPAILGRQARIGSTPMQIVGVAPREFAGAELQRRYDVWAPTALVADFSNPRETSNYIWIRILARLKPGVSRVRANEQLKAVSASIDSALPKNHANARQVFFARDASNGLDRWRTGLHDPLVVLMGAVTLVLLLACVNLANLLLARCNERRHEFAIKLSLGISRFRLLRELLLETALLTFCGGAMALAVSYGLTQFLLALFNGPRQTRSLYVTPDSTVILFTLGGCILTALLAGLYPAWNAARTEVSSGLKGGSAKGVRGSLARRALIVVQIAITLVLLFGASLFTHSLRNLKTIDLGYDIDHVVTVSVNQRGRSRDRHLVKAPPELGAILSRVRHLPSVESAAISEPGMLQGGMMGGDATSRGASGDLRQAADVYFMFASPGYFPTLRMPLLRGRDFDRSDTPNSPRVAIVNQRFASTLWPNEDPVGKRFDAWDAKQIEIVGLVGDSKYQGVREKSHPIVVFAFDQMKVDGGTFEIRCRNLAGVEHAVRQIVKSAAPQYEVADVSAMEILRDTGIAQDRLLAFLSDLFGGLGIVLALVGIYGLISYSVTRRTREVGIRMSVGAQRRNVIWLFLREIAILLAAGIAAGLPLALLLARNVRKMLFEVSPSDPAAIAAAILLLASGALIASSLPARRATRIDPVQALRYD